MIKRTSARGSRIKGCCFNQYLLSNRTRIWAGVVPAVLRQVPCGQDGPRKSEVPAHVRLRTQLSARRSPSVASPARQQTSTREAMHGGAPNRVVGMLLFAQSVKAGQRRDAPCRYCVCVRWCTVAVTSIWDVPLLGCSLSCSGG